MTITPARSTCGAFYRSQLGAFGGVLLWSFSDFGHIYGGQAGALREYEAKNPGVVSVVSESPWSISGVGKIKVRYDAENDNTCLLNHLDGRGPNTIANQRATANCIIPMRGNLTKRVTVKFSGQALRSSFYYIENVQVRWNGRYLAIASPADDQGELECDAALGPITAISPGGFYDVNGNPYFDDYNTSGDGIYDLLEIEVNMTNYYHWRGSERLSDDGVFYQVEITKGAIP